MPFTIINFVRVFHAVGVVRGWYHSIRADHTPQLIFVDNTTDAVFNWGDLYAVFLGLDKSVVELAPAALEGIGVAEDRAVG